MASLPFDPIEPTELGVAIRVRVWADQAVVPIDAGAIARAAAAPRLRGPALPVLGRGPRPIVRLVLLLVALAFAAGTLLLVPGLQPSPTPAPDPWVLSPPLGGREVMPGVTRIGTDVAGRRMHDARPPDDVGLRGVAFAPDGGAWVLDERELYRLGRAEGYPLPGGDTGAALGAAPDGSVWAVADGQVVAPGGDAWADVPAFPGTAHGIAVLPDGGVWAVSDAELLRLEGDRWIGVPVQGEIDWAAWNGGLAASSDGSLWLRTRPGEGLLRYDGDSWATIPFPAFPVQQTPAGRVGPDHWAVGADGVVWVYHINASTNGKCLARYADGGWSVFTDEIPGIANPASHPGYMAVAPDGRLWATAKR
jgi:hypothetical protein